MPLASRLAGRWRSYPAATAAALVAAAAAARLGDSEDDAAFVREPQAPTLAFAFLISAASNKVLLRLLLVPLGRYTHLLGVVTNLLYLVVFGLQCKFATGRGSAATKRSWRLSADFVRPGGGGLQLLSGSGLCEAAAFVFMPLFASRLPGTLNVVTSQGLLFFSMIFSYLLLGRRFGALQVAGVAVVVVGVLMCTLPTLGVPAVGAYVPVSLWNVVGLFCSYGFIALGLSLKEVAFLRFREKVVEEGESLDTNVVNFTTAVFQGLGLLFMWPLNFAFITPLSVGAYFEMALRAMQQWAPLLVLYLMVNLGYTLVTTSVLKRLSALTILLTNVLNVPLVSLFFCLNLPLLGAAPFRWSFVGGLVVIITGMLLYNHRSLGFVPGRQEPAEASKPDGAKASR